MDKIENVIPLPSLPLPLPLTMPIPMGALALPTGVIEALAQAGVLPSIITGEALSLTWGRKSSRVFVTNRSAAVASPIRVIEVHVDRVPVFRAYSEGAWRNGIDTSRFGGSGWLNWSEQRAMRESVRARRRSRLEQYRVDLQTVMASLSGLHYQEGQKGGIFVVNGGDTVSAVGVFRKIHNRNPDSWEEFQGWIETVT